ncbi:MAG: 4Fe-4S dicluster domain-containing protein [bacterium]
MSQLGWKIDLTKCVGCHTCEVACKAENNTYPQYSPIAVKGVDAEKVNWRVVIEKESGIFPTPKRDFITMSCNHCDEPACLKSCPVGAITKREEDGVVLIDQERCVGCRYCEWACPYGAPKFNTSTGKVEKCTFCSHRLAEGLEPACVSACMGRALEVIRDPVSVGEVPEGFADPTLTLPNVQFER